MAATKASLEMPAVSPSGDGARLGDDWRTRIPADVVQLAAAWRDLAAWSGMTKAGPVEMPAEVGGLVALDELVVHEIAVPAAAHPRPRHGRAATPRGRQRRASPCAGCR
jgi:hypothetical protein